MTNFKCLKQKKYWIDFPLMDAVHDIWRHSFSIELLIQQEYEQIHIHFSFIKHFHYSHTFILHLKQIL